MPRTSSALSRQSAHDRPPRSTSQPDRLTTLEAAIAEIQQTLDVQFKRMASMQAEIDHLTAKSRNG
jgi:hypothetical protein